MAASKYATLKRSQLLVRLLQLDAQLLATDSRGRPRIKWGTPRDRELRSERAKLLDEIHARDDAIVAHWRAGLTCSQRPDLR